mmetsp:Transcript_150741/g.281146  ORF Transcript_150741/g.281146 Transcript_150741/m.281146 type:complete len:236 (-) Transcript_150741:58-765(-)
MLDMFSQGVHADEILPVKVVAAVSGHEVALQCKRKLAVQDVKREVDRLWDIPVRQQQLVAGETVAHNDVEICSLGISGEVMLSLVRVDIPDFQEGDRVIAVKDSPHSLWQKAGDQGTVVEVDGYGGVVVFWDMHHAATPFGPEILGANPFEVLRIARTRTRALRVGDAVVATENGGDAASPYLAGNEGTIQSIDEGVIIVLWKDSPNKISIVDRMHVGSNNLLLAVCKVAPLYAC